MVEALIDWAHGHDVRKVNLEVRADNARAIALYVRLGFREEGRVTRAFCIEGRFFDGLVMGLEIDGQ